MTNFFESELFEPIDLCSCFEPIFDPPPEQEAAWNFSEPEPGSTGSDQVLIEITGQILSVE